jgi:hypothetical protein
MSEPYAVLVRYVTTGKVDTAYGPLEEDEADALARELRDTYELRVEVVRLQGFNPSRWEPRQ